MTDNTSNKHDRLYVELVVRPTHRQPSPAADEHVVALMRESNQAVVSSHELQQLLAELPSITGCDALHECLTVREDLGYPGSPYVEVTFKPECFPGPEGGETIRFRAATLLQQARARTYQAATVRC